MDFVFTKETVNRYVEGYYKKRYPIHPDFENFWELVLNCIFDKDYEIIINDEKRGGSFEKGYILRYQIGKIDHCSVECKECHNSAEFIKFLANEIREVVSKYEPLDYTGLDLFILEKRIDKLENSLTKLENNLKTLDVEGET